MSALTVGDLRPSVVAFALAMEEKLRANAHKGNRAAWRRDNPNALCARVFEEAEELQREVSPWVCELAPDLHRACRTTAEDRARIRAEAADVGNMAMMVADACGAFALAHGDE